LPHNFDEGKTLEGVLKSSTDRNDAIRDMKLFCVGGVSIWRVILTTYSDANGLNLISCWI